MASRSSSRRFRARKRTVRVCGALSLSSTLDLVSSTSSRMPDAHDLHRRIAASLDRRREKSTLRSLDPPSYNPAELVDFSSNDYLSLSRSSGLQERLRSALTSHSGPLYGPASSRLLDGNSTLHLELEDLLRTFYQGPSALLFNSGFDANVGIFSCLPSTVDAIVYDELIHASCHDGMRHSRARARLPFKHNDPVDLERILSTLQTKDGFESGVNQVYVAVESLYSMDGDLAPLGQFLDVIERTFPKGNCHLILDEAHTTGLCGPQGRGLACALGVQDRILIRLHTFGKAMSCGGGVIICSPTLRNYFVNYARPLIYSTAMSHLAVLAMRHSVLYMQEGHADAARQNLQSLAQHTQGLLQSSLATLPFVFHLPPTAEATRQSMGFLSPIIPVLTRHPRPLSKYLISKGYLVRPIAHPTVPKGQERIRICLHAANTKAEIEGLVENIVQWTKSREARTLFTDDLLKAKL